MAQTNMKELTTLPAQASLGDSDQLKLTEYESEGI